MLILAGMIGLLLAPTISQAQEGPVLSFGLSPVGAPDDYSEIIPFYELLSTFPNGGILQNSLWRDDAFWGTDAGQIPESVLGTLFPAQVFGFTPIVSLFWHDSGAGFIRVPGNLDNTWRNLDARALFKQMLTTLLTDYKPPFLFLGVENSFYYESHTADYPPWIEFYEELYVLAKSLSPDTQVGITFQFEHLSGIAPALEWETPQWEALEMHDLAKVDIIGLSVYAFLAHDTPELLPDDYLAPLFDRIGSKPVAIMETGWPAVDVPQPFLQQLSTWETSESAQVRFIDRLSTILAGRDMPIVNWLYFNEPTSPTSIWPGGVFQRIALRDNTGVSRPAESVWFDTFGDPTFLFQGDFESGTICRWGDVSAGPVCPPL